ncbi:MAG: hypothetical protein P4M07_11570 [Xanthobacteraceae bacterium]|nr:hypothetical protein [Xanthobacteraceae bacterium]
MRDDTSAPRRWTVPIRLAIAALAILAATRSDTVRAQQWAQSRPSDIYRDGVRYRDVQFGDTTYRLPVSKYMIGITPYDKERNHAAFTFDAILPDVTPASDDPEEVAKWGKGKGWFRQIHGLIEYGRNFITQERMAEEAFKYSQSLKALRDAGTKKHQELLADLKYLDPNVYTTLANGCRRYEGEALAGNIFQVCGSGDDDNMLVVECRTGNAHFRVPSPSCEVMINVADNTQLTYFYGYDYFERAQDIHRKVVALIKSFRIDAKP